MNKKNKTLISLLVGPPLACFMILIVSFATGIPEAIMFKLVLGVLPATLITLVVISYHHKECLYFGRRRQSFWLQRDDVFSITRQKDPILFHCFQVILLAGTIALIIGIFHINLE